MPLPDGPTRADVADDLDRLLAARVDAARDVIAVARLGDLQGDAGTDALRRALTRTGRGSRDLRCAALVALAKRCGADATPWLRDALAITDGIVKDFAVLALAGVGDGRAWAAGR
jgi:hypothetical protein